MTTPAGWYADPADSARTRWWDGTQWTEHTAPHPNAPAQSTDAADAAVAEPAATEPATEAAAEPAAEPAVEPAATEPATQPAATESAIPPAAPIAPAAPLTQAPRYGEYAPAQTAAAASVAPQSYPATQSHQAAATYPAAPSYPNYPSAPGYAVATGPSAPGANTHTLWIYLSIAASFLPMISLLFVDWTGYFRTVLSIEASGNSQAPEAVAAIFNWMGSVMLVSALSYVAIAVSIVFAWLDWRELKKRGVARPFHWGFAFFALIVGIGVYVIGRTVVLRRETGSGLTALWVWIGSIALSLVMGLVFFAVIWQQILDLIPTYGLS